jgi:hypothetical protein
MRILVNRITSDSEATLSTISIDDKFECFGLEDEYREEKVAGETRIPAGTYQVGVRAEGGFHNRYSAKYPDFHRGMLQVLDVPNFEYILIHVGNTDADTAGCLLVGDNATTAGRITIPSSGSAYKSIYPKLIDAAEAGELSITYVDNDRL